MYKLLKQKGYDALISVENTETKANVIIGNISMDILKVLDAAGIPSMDGLTAEEWNLEVNTECAKALVGLTMKMKKPIRDQRKKTEEPKKSNKEIDAMDVLLGLAQYS